MTRPERINVMKVVTYQVDEIVDSLKEMNDDPDYAPTIDEVMKYIEDWVYEDFGSLSGLIFQDENGDEL